MADLASTGAHSMYHSTTDGAVSLQHDFRTIPHADFTIYCKHRRFQVDESVLRARSSYFDAMFAGHFEESRSRVAYYPEIRPDLMLALLNVFYTGGHDVAFRNRKLSFVKDAAKILDFEIEVALLGARFMIDFDDLFSTQFMQALDNLSLTGSPFPLKKLIDLYHQLPGGAAQGKLTRILCPFMWNVLMDEQNVELLDTSPDFTLALLENRSWGKIWLECRVHFCQIKVTIDLRDYFAAFKGVGCFPMNHPWDHDPHCSEVWYLRGEEREPPSWLLNAYGCVAQVANAEEPVLFKWLRGSRPAVPAKKRPEDPECREVDIRFDCEETAHPFPRRPRTRRRPDWRFRGWQVNTCKAGRLTSRGAHLGL